MSLFAPYPSVGLLQSGQMLDLGFPVFRFYEAAVREFQHPAKSSPTGLHPKAATRTFDPVPGKLSTGVRHIGVIMLTAKIPSD